MRSFILIDHGSRRAEANEQLLDMAARVQRLRPHDVVTIAHMEIASPSLSDAVAEVVARGATEIIILPYFLSSGRHVTHDIPDLAQAACAAFPAVTYRIGQALGPHDALATLLLERAEVS
jgi:sirohydrochlorin ferrochelatase